MNKPIPTEEIISQTSQLVAIPSTLDDHNALRQAVDFVVDFVAAHTTDVTIERFEKNGITSFVAYRGAQRPEKFDILLNGHVDVVPANPEQFVPFEKDGRLYGRGTLDMKGTVMVLASVFAELVHEVPYALGLQIVSDEENSGINGVQHQLTQGVRADFVITGEYANEENTIYTAARGLCWMEVAFKGKTAHGGHPWKGDNAIVKASNFIGEIIRRYPVPAQETWTTTATIASISTPNDTYNQIPDYAVVKVDFRFTKDDETFRHEESIRELIADIDPMAELINMPTYGPAVHVEKTNSFVKGLHEAIQATTGVEPDYLARPASGDGRHFANAGIESIEFGLFGHNSHANDEYVELSSFETYASTMRTFLKNPRR